MHADQPEKFQRLLEKWAILSVNWRHITDLVSAKEKTKEVYNKL